ncbi:hypothetical protein BGX38DRAFT_1278765 [Terfezia claveryi]|nr:hypothetical protein BGX38DRAFT_1278765 [Terfezia claveryi]
MHSWHRSYIEYDCRQKILRLYRLDFQSKEEVEKKVDWLLYKDRFILRHRFRAAEIVMVIYECFFWRPKIRGKRDSKIFDHINSILICLVASAIQYCLKELKSGEDTEAIEFKYEMAEEKVRTLILANIKVDLRIRIGEFDKKAKMEASDLCTVVEGASYISELQEELKNTMLAQNLAGSDAIREEIRSQGTTGTEEAIGKINEDVGGSQWEGSPTDIDQPVEGDDDEDWQESQVAY